MSALVEGQAAIIKRRLATQLAAAEKPNWVERIQDWGPPSDFMTRSTVARFAVDEWIQDGKVGALVSAGGTGKTTIKLILLISHALGRPFFGQAVRQGTFVLLSLDDPQEDLDAALVRVMKAMRLTDEECGQVLRHSRVVSLIGERECLTFTAPEHGAVVATNLGDKVLEAVAGIRDLVGIGLDTLRQFCGGSSNDEQVVKLTISAATRIAHETGAYVILSHHVGKQNYRDGISDMYAGSGSAALADNCRFVFVLQTTTWPDIESKVRRTGQERGDPLVLTSTRGSLLVRAPAPMYLHRDGFYVGRVAGALLSREQQADNKDRAILEAVRAGNNSSKNKIAKAVGGNRNDVLRRIDDLVSRRHLGQGGSASGSSSTTEFIVTATGAKLLDGDL
jgi:RecA-family ATPase